MIYIQSNEERNLPNHFDCACALYGAEELGLPYRLTTIDEIISGKFDNLIRTRLFVGSVEFMKMVFNRIGLKDVKVPKNSNREHKVITIDEAKEIAKERKIFIKPFDIKLFTGSVLDGMQLMSLSNIPGNTKVMAYDVFDSPIVSEWRLYVKRDEIIDSRNYSGNFMINPDYNYAENVIEVNEDFPICYTIDIGILENGENVVIEFNDMWAIGNYGMDNYIYLRLLRERYFEIVK